MKPRGRNTKRSRLVFTLLFALTLLGTAVPSQAESMMNPENPYGFDGIGINVTDSWVNNGDQASLLRGVKTVGGKSKNFICNDLGDCNLSNLDSVAGNVLLEGCKSNASRDCVYQPKLSFGEFEISGEYLGQSGGEKVIGDSRLGLPGGGGVSLWRFPIPTSESAILVAIHASVNVSYDKKSRTFEQNELSVTAIPYTLKAGNYLAPSSKVSTDANGNDFVGTSGFPPDCAWVTKTQCGLFSDFPDGAEFEVGMVLSKQLGGWLMGRVLSPDVLIESVDNNHSRVVISGAVVAVPKVFVVAPKTQAQQEMDKAFPNAPAKLNVVNVKANSSWTSNLLEIFRNLAADRAYGEYKVWSFSSQATKDPCFKPSAGFQGFVSTNASVYQGTPPAMQNGQLRYRVSGYHFQSDGITPNIGQYSLIMRSTSAKCMYGFSNAPIAATIEVTGVGADQKVETAVLGEKNGWLRFAATGFTYSNKQVVVTLTQAGSSLVSKFNTGVSKLSTPQKAQIQSAINRSSGLKKFICTGTYLQPKDLRIAKARAKAVCDFAKTLNPNLSFWAQAKQSKSKSYESKVLIVTKGE